MNTERMKSINNQFKVIIPVDMRPYPDNYEEEVARILARRLQSDMLFVPPSNSLHTPDLQLRSKMTYLQAISRIRYFLSRPHGNIKQIILVTKGGKAIDFYE